MKRKYYRCPRCGTVFAIAAIIASEYKTCPKCANDLTVRATATQYRHWREERQL